MSTILVRKYEVRDGIHLHDLFEDVDPRMPPCMDLEMPELAVAARRRDVLKLLDDGLSVVAEDTESKEIIGCCINRHSSAQGYLYETYGAEAACEALSLCDEMINNARKLGNLQEKFDGEAIFTMFYLGVKEKYGRRGIGSELVGKSVEVAKEKGYGCAIIDCNSRYTVKCCERHGFESLYSVRYDEWKSKDGKLSSNVYDMEALKEHEKLVFAYKLV